MAIRDIVAQNASLDNDYGTTHGPNAPASHELALFVGDPMEDGVELSGDGYARVEIAAADWADAANGYKSLLAAAEFPPPTDEWPDPVTYWALFDVDVMWDCAPLTEPLDVTAASDTGPLVMISVFYNDAVMEEV